ncbi:LysE family translocator [Desulfosediminicola flagellatus]|uniref:LysE family translocator n=1 Tax=Desulfosediminicola flagellatus TaxID=2569541 RepID=UPI0010ABD735|nr:LysE family translocator [Desulfosediminicola flagellatus]
MVSTEFLLTSLVVVLIPGTGVIYTVSNGLFIGWRAAIAAAIGCTAGIVPHLVTSILGLSAILHMSALAFQAIKYAGALYLLFLAWSMWKETGGISLTTTDRRSLLQVGIRGILLNILNPKLSIFFLAFLPLFISTETPTPMTDMLLLSGIFMAMTLLVFIIYGLCANGVRKYIVNSPRIVTRVQRSFAAVFAMLGLKLALTER